ncbi:hypothetical protein BGZ51_002598 [Haplosporangium sp. Z 767]|nr:hypothetical protein BGZ50_009353 [Haplosporangium sp. Z 11]KAF9193650.1 hypothetical protein BGZ51_002598 [Haplosporangium sp. Z 767]
MFTTTNFRFLRINKHNVLPLNLLLAKDDLEWFNDYTFQAILTVLKPLLLSRIELYNSGHIIKRTSKAPVPFLLNNSADQDDGLEDAGVVLGGSGGINAIQDNVPSSSIDNNSRGSKRRRVGAGSNPLDRPQFCIRFGFRASTALERGGAVLVADKNLGFSRVKKEVIEEDQRVQKGRRISMELATLEDEKSMQDDVIGGGVVIREEDESDNLRVSDFRADTAKDDDNDNTNEDNNTGDDGDYQFEASASQPQGNKRELSTRAKRNGKRAKTDDMDVQSSQVDQKPTLQVNYSSLAIHPQTLYIVVRSLGSSTATAPASSILPFSSTIEEKSSMPSGGSSSSGGTGGDTGAGNASGRVLDPQDLEDDEESLFPPGMDDLSSL